MYQCHAADIVLLAQSWRSAMTVGGAWCKKLKVQRMKT